jgi:hypothetical protein
LDMAKMCFALSHMLIVLCYSLNVCWHCHIFVTQLRPLT